MEQELLEKTIKDSRFMWIVDKYIALYKAHATFNTCWYTSVIDISKLTGKSEYESWAMLAKTIHQRQDKDLSRFTSNLYCWWCERYRTNASRRKRID